MKIAVCIKRVPDMDLRFAIGAGGKALDPAGLKFDIADFDGYAVEAALRLVEAHGSGEVVVVSVGPDAVQETLRKALGMGADRAIQLKADEVPFDGLAVATALAAELKDGGYDLVLFGRMATDSANQTVGPMTAHLMGVPCVTAISKLDIAGGRGTARAPARGRQRDGRVPAAGRRHHRRGAGAPAAPVAQGDHGRQEEAARGQAGAARRRAA